MQEREADTLGAVIFSSAGYDSQRALKLFDKLAEHEARGQAGESAGRPAIRER